MGAARRGLDIGDPWDIARLLLVFSVVFAVAFREEPERAHEARANAVTAARLPT